MSRIKPNAINMKILSACGKQAGISYHSLLEATLLEQSILSHRLKRLQQNAYVSKAGDFWWITPQGVAFLKAWETDILNQDSVRKTIQNGSEATSGRLTEATSDMTSTPPSNTATPKRHFQALYYPLKDAIAKLDLRMMLLQAGIAYTEDGIGQLHFSYGLTAQLHSAYLMLYSPELRFLPDTPSMDMEAKATAILDAKALELEKSFNRFYSFKLVRTDKGALISYFSKEEIAHEGHPLAEEVEESKLVLAKSPIDNKERLIVDSSKLKTLGFKELEPTHKVTAGEDSDKLDSEFKGVEASSKDWNDLLDSKIKLGWLGDLPAIKEIASQNTLSIAEQRQWFAHHDQQIVESTKLARRLNILLPAALGIMLVIVVLMAMFILVK